MQQGQKTSLWTKIGYALGDTGAQYVWGLAGFLTLYYTDSVLVSAGMVGTMMLIVRIFDGISDILMGGLIENTSTKFGKARPWFGATIIPLMITMLLCFRVPQSWSTGAKTVYIYVTYFLLAVVFYTANNLSNLAMLPRIFTDSNDLNKASAIQRAMTILASLSVSLLITPLLTAFGGEKSQNAWSTVSLMSAGCGLLLMAICFFVAKERIPAEKPVKVKKEISFKESIKLLLHTKYFYISILVFIFTYIMNGLVFNGAIYYARDVMGDANYYSLMALVVVGISIFGMIITPPITKKGGKRAAMIVAGITGVLGHGVVIFAPRSLVVVLVGLGLRSIGYGMISTIMFTFAADIVEHLYHKTGKRLEGIATAASSVGVKVGTGLSSAVLGWTLQLGGYDGAAAVQAASVQTAEIIGVFVIPLICEIAVLIVSFFWDYDKVRIQEAAEAAAIAE